MPNRVKSLIETICHGDSVNNYKMNTNNGR